MSFGIIVKDSRKQMVKHQKELIRRSSNLQNKGVKGTDRRQKHIIQDYLQVSKQGGLKFKDEMPDRWRI